MKKSEMYRLAAEHYEAKENGTPFDVQYRDPKSGKWKDYSERDEPTWLSSLEYRRKPEARVLWAIEKPDGSLHRYDSKIYICSSVPACESSERPVKFVEVLE